MCQEWLVDTGYCFAGGLASVENGAVYAAAPVAESAGWAYMYKEDHDEEFPNETGDATETVTINEPHNIKQAITEGRCPHGVWFGGVKYKVIRQDLNFESGDYSFNCVVLAKEKGGGHLVATPGGTIVIALFDENLEQTSGNCRRVALAFAEYLAEQQY
ncbi:unnamed protein product [Vitrella brassicaformis CCMP3155]|uniref:Profilin n=2 Tax=Vitrella brassicaformis TaxID=1169539 RepID=A0A0G4EGN7_VITBC|nr:unnamed protein product [Vitrella brassicaformis CCMP3155]|eukprot:CEL94628.1 unnamed protein product [Vitrella brassicaformis CCMP3155]